MQLIKNKTKFDAKKIAQILERENKFITDIFSVTAIPERKDFDEQISDLHNFGFIANGKKTTRAKSLNELQQRLVAITSKKKLTYREKLVKRALKNRMKKKSKHDERNAKQKLARAAKLMAKEEVETKDGDVEKNSTATKPIFNSEDKMVFSKIDFADLGKKTNKKQEKDPKKLLKKLQEQKEKIQKLEESGETEKAVQIKEKTSWQNALARVKGQKVKDDPTLLKKSMKKKEQKQRSSKKKWENRIQGVQRAKDQRQQKRTENIQKRKKDKKNNKLKKASKRGKIIPGF